MGNLLKTVFSFKIQLGVTYLNNFTIKYIIIDLGCCAKFVSNQDIFPIEDINAW